MGKYFHVTLMPMFFFPWACALHRARAPGVDNTTRNIASHERWACENLRAGMMGGPVTRPRAGDDTWPRTSRPKHGKRSWQYEIHFRSSSVVTSLGYMFLPFPPHALNAAKFSIRRNGSFDSFMACKFFMVMVASN